MTFGLRQKLAVGFGGLLAMLLLVSVLGVTVLARYQRSLDRFVRENGRSVEYGQQIVDDVGKLDELARASWVAAPRQGTADELLADGDHNCAAEDNNITLDGEREIAAALTLAWSGKSLAGTTVTADCYQAAVRRLMDPAVTGGDRAAAADAARRLSPVVRARAADVIRLNLANMRPVSGQAKRVADRAVAVMAAGAVAGTLLAVAFTLLVARSILRPLTTVIGSIREVERGNLDLVVQVPARDEFGVLAEAFNAMAARLREYRRTDRATLARTRQSTQLAVNSLPDAVAVTAPDGTVELSNDAAERLFGLTPGADMAAVADRRLLDVYREVAGSGRPSAPRGYESAVEVYDAGGSLRYFLPRAVPIADGDRAVGVTLVLADVTNLRRLDEMKSGLLSVVSHELKTPLTSIRMAVHLLGEERVGPLTAKQSELVMAAREDADRLDRIIADLLDMGRMESGRAELDLRPAKPSELAEAAVGPLRAAFADKGVAVDVAVPADLPAVRVDPARVGHVFTNLLTNALKFTDPGGRVAVSAAADGADRVRFAVADTGCGIPAEHVGRVFDRFFRVPGQTRGDGAGLGLAITQDIVQAHGGSIDVASDVGRGTRFGFTLATTPTPTEVTT